MSSTSFEAIWLPIKRCFLRSCIEAVGRWRLGWIGTLTGAALAYLVLSLLLTSEHVLRSRWGADSKWDSFGWHWVMERLLRGEIFDGESLPVITLLVALRVISTAFVLRRRQDHLRTWFLTCFLLWIVLFFGRASLGSLVNLLPLSQGLHMSRFITGVQLFGLILGALGLTALTGWMARLHGRWGVVAAAAVVVALLAVPASKRTTFMCRNEAWATAAKQGYDAAAGFRSIVQLLRSSPEGRVHAGFPGTWGEELKIGGVPTYSLLQGAGFDMVGYLFLHQMQPEEWQFLMDPRRQEYCDLYNVRYLLMPKSRTAPAFASERARWSNMVLYQVPTTGYFGLGKVAGLPQPELRGKLRQSPTGDEIYQAGDAWMQGDGPAQRSYLAYRNPQGVEPFGGREGVIKNQQIAPGRHSAEVDAESEVGLILKVTYHPYWRVTVDGVPTRVTRVFPGFMAIRLDQGKHQVVFQYRAPIWKKLLATLPPLLLLLTLASYGSHIWRRHQTSSLE